MPDAARAVNGYPPGSSQGRDATLVPTSSHCVSTRQRQRTLAHRSSSRPVPDAVEPRLSPRRSAQRSSANAPVGGLRPPPAGRLQRAKQPPSLLQHRLQRDHHLPIRPASCVRVHNISRTAPSLRRPSYIDLLLTFGTHGCRTNHSETRCINWLTGSHMSVALIKARDWESESKIRRLVGDLSHHHLNSEYLNGLRNSLRRVQASSSSSTSLPQGNAMKAGPPAA